MTKPLIAIKNLHVGFQIDQNKIDAVKGIDFEIKSGETLGLVGQSGSGKSVTALAILKLLPYPNAFHRHGKILFEGRDILNIDNHVLSQIRGNDISMIFQEPMTSLNPLHTIERQISEVLILHRGFSRKRAAVETLRLLKRVGIHEPEKRLTARAHELSGGQRQRVMIAMALANQPKLLIADEPTTALDVTIQKQILDLLKELQAEMGMALLLITHDLGIVRHMTDRVCVINDGKIVETGNTKKIFAKPQHKYTKQLITAEPKSTTQPIDNNAPTLVSVKNLRVRFIRKKNLFLRPHDYIKAVDNVSFSIKQGETLGIVGESGSGKTTLARAVLALQKAKGEVVINGQTIIGRKNADLRQARKNMQIVFQDPYGSLSPRLSVHDIVGEGLTVHAPTLSQHARQTRIAQTLKDVGMDPDSATRFPHEFSGGQRQRIAIARAIILNPKFIVLDEPTSALDRTVQAQIIDLLRSLQRKKAMAYAFISHDLKVIRTLAHRIIVMKDGQCIEQGTVEDIFKTPKMEYTQSLIEAAFD